MNLLRKPYPTSESLRSKLVTSILFGLFIFLFLAVFQPFGLYNWKDPNKLLLLGGYGMVTSLTVAFYILLIPTLLPKFFSEQGWTVWKEIMQLVIIITTIGILNTIYTNQIGLIELTLSSFINYGLITIVVSILPVTTMILLNSYRLQIKNIQIAKGLNVQLDKTAEKREIITSTDAELNIDGFILNQEQLIYAKSSDNYIEVHFLDNTNSIQREIIRFTLKQLEELLIKQSAFFRCHRSFLINLRMIEEVQGNSQGQKLRLKKGQEMIPVSRNLTGELEKRLMTLDMEG